MQDEEVNSERRKIYEPRMENNVLDEMRALNYFETSEVHHLKPLLIPLFRFFWFLLTHLFLLLDLLSLPHSVRMNDSSVLFAIETLSDNLDTCTYFDRRVTGCVLLNHYSGRMLDHSICIYMLEI